MEEKIKNKRAVDMIRRDIEEMKSQVGYRRDGLMTRIKELAQKQLEISELEAKIREQEEALKKLDE